MEKNVSLTVVVETIMTAAEDAQQDDTTDSLIGTTIILGVIYLSYAVLSIWILFRNKKEDQFFLLDRVRRRDSTLYGHLRYSYRYTISIYTGAATYGSVRLKLIGSSNESTLHYLQNCDGMCTLKRDSISTFLLNADHNLGDIREIQFRRTGTAENGEIWFFKRICVRDLEKNKCWFFKGRVTFHILETDTWLRPSSTRQEQASFGMRWENMFKERHSLFALTPLTNWHHRALTRLERVSVFYLSVFMIMITTLGISGEIGQTLYSGFASPFIVAPVTHCIMEIFRLAQRSNISRIPENPLAEIVIRKRRKSSIVPENLATNSVEGKQEIAKLPENAATNQVKGKQENSKVPENAATNQVKGKQENSKVPEKALSSGEKEISNKKSELKEASSRLQPRANHRVSVASSDISDIELEEQQQLVPSSGNPGKDKPPAPQVVTWSGPLPCGQDERDSFEWGRAKTPVPRTEIRPMEDVKEEDEEEVASTPSPPPLEYLNKARKSISQASFHQSPFKWLRQKSNLYFRRARQTSSQERVHKLPEARVKKSDSTDEDSDSQEQQSQKEEEASQKSQEEEDEATTSPTQHHHDPDPDLDKAEEGDTSQMPLQSKIELIHEKTTATKKTKKIHETKKIKETKKVKKIKKRKPSPPPNVKDWKGKVVDDPNSNTDRPLPGFFRLIAWFLIVVTIVTSTVFCVLQNNNKDFTSTWNWWAHSLLAIVISVFVLEPMKIFLITLISYQRHPTLQISEWLPPIPSDLASGYLVSNPVEKIASRRGSEMIQDSRRLSVGVVGNLADRRGSRLSSRRASIDSVGRRESQVAMQPGRLEAEIADLRRKSITERPRRRSSVTFDLQKSKQTSG